MMHLTNLSVSGRQQVNLWAWYLGYGESANAGSVAGRDQTDRGIWHVVCIFYLLPVLMATPVLIPSRPRAFQLTSDRDTAREAHVALNPDGRILPPRHLRFHNIHFSLGPFAHHNCRYLFLPPCPVYHVSPVHPEATLFIVVVVGYQALIFL
jgi:hypothetical protein